MHTILNIFQAFETLGRDTELSVEGCHYELVREDRYGDVLNFYSYQFVPDEPVGRCLSIDWNKDYEELVTSVLKFNISIAMVRDRTGEIVGIRLNRLINKNMEYDPSKFQSEKFKLIEGFYNNLAELEDIFLHYDVEDAVHFFALGVRRDNRGKGIGSKLMKAGISLVKNLNVGPIALTGEASSAHSMRIYEKSGFDMLAEIVYADYKVNGVVVFQDVGEETCQRLYGQIVY